MKSSHADAILAQKQAQKDYEIALKRQAEEARRQEAIAADEATQQAADDAKEMEMAAEEVRRQAEIDAKKTAKARKMHRLSAIEEATESAKKFADAWKHAGSPSISKESLDRAKSKADALLAKFRSIHRKHEGTKLSILYLRVASWIRNISARFDLPWYTITIISGAIFLIFAIFLAVLVANFVANTFIINFAICVTGFLLGSSVAMCLLFLPDDVEGEKYIAVLKEQSEVKPLEACKVASANAKLEYDNVLNLFHIQNDCEKAIARLKHLREEYKKDYGESA